MGKHRIILFFLTLFFIAPLLAHADGEGASLNFETVLQGFYWGTNIATPQYKTSSGSFVTTVDVRFRPGSGMENWGFGAEYNNIVNGPRFVNTGGAYQTSFNGVNGWPVSQNGVFGLIVPGSIQFGGGKIKYFLPTTHPNLRADVYACYFTATAGLTAIGGGAELGYRFNHDWDISAFADLSNSNGNGFPAQTLVRYQTVLAYNIPDTSVQALVGYRAFNYTSFNNTYISGLIAGLGAHF